MGGEKTYEIANTSYCLFADVECGNVLDTWEASVSESDLKERFTPPEIIARIYAAVVEDLRRESGALSERAAKFEAREDRRSDALAERAEWLGAVVDAAICFARECTRDIDDVMLNARRSKAEHALVNAMRAYERSSQEVAEITRAETNEPAAAKMSALDRTLLIDPKPPRPKSK